MTTSAHAAHAVIVGRFVRRPGIEYPGDAPHAITVERYWHTAGQHDAWRVVSIYVCGKRVTARVFELDGTSRLTCARHIAYGTGQPGFGGIRM